MGCSGYRCCRKGEAITPAKNTPNVGAPGCCKAQRALIADTLVRLLSSSLKLRKARLQMHLFWVQVLQKRTHQGWAPRLLHCTHALSL